MLPSTLAFLALKFGMRRLTRIRLSEGPQIHLAPYSLLVYHMLFTGTCGCGNILH